MIRDKLLTINYGS